MITLPDIYALAEKFRIWRQAHPPGSAAAHAYQMCEAALVPLEQRELGEDQGGSAFHECRATLDKFLSLHKPGLRCICFCGQQWVYTDIGWQRQGEPS